MSTKNYKPGELILILDGAPIEGKVAVTFTYPNDLNTDSFDLEGEVTHSENVNANYANIDVELSQATASNLIMSGLIALNSTFSLGFNDNSGNSVHLVPECVFAKYPDAEYSQEATTRTWQLKGYDTSAIIGGN